MAGKSGGSKGERDNRANQLNPNNDAYWQARGEAERPDDWEDRTADHGGRQDQPRNPDNQRSR